MQRTCSFRQIYFDLSNRMDLPVGTASACKICIWCAIAILCSNMLYFCLAIVECDAWTKDCVSLSACLSQKSKRAVGCNFLLWSWREKDECKSLLWLLCMQWGVLPGAWQCSLCSCDLKLVRQSFSWVTQHHTSDNINSCHTFRYNTYVLSLLLLLSLL